LGSGSTVFMTVVATGTTIYLLIHHDDNVEWILMNIHVKNVEIGAEYQSVIYDFWIVALLENGESIKIFDCVPFDIRKYLGKTIKVVLSAGFLKNISCTSNFERQVYGEFLGEYKIPDWSTNHRQDEDRTRWLGIKTNNGIFLLNPSEFENLKMSIGDRLAFDVGRFDLIAVSHLKCP